MLNKEIRRYQIVLGHFATVAWNIMFGYGVLSIIYGYWFTYTGSGWDALNSLIRFIGFSLTLVSVSVTCISIYIPARLNQPSLLSKYVSAPSVILLMSFIGIEAIYMGRYPHEAVLTGAALMGLSGSLHQMIPRYHEMSWHNKSIHSIAKAAAD